ncbi:hypothetical protein GCM10023195_16070 [Actinoallomurus liliacearum]|uniref:Uncharacterized protein n=1 Tax=Actinoallomurus liliacearum TaxID=1080073 RepID=A0ABP8TEW1_9ACTN
MAAQLTIKSSTKEFTVEVATTIPPVALDVWATTPEGEADLQERVRGMLDRAGVESASAVFTVRGRRTSDGGCTIEAEGTFTEIRVTTTIDE